MKQHYLSSTEIQAIRDKSNKTNQLKAAVYFISGAGAVKIGKSTNVVRRKGQLQTASFENLTELGRIYCESSRQAYFLEKFLHEYFKEFRIRPDREWFSKHPLLADFIRKSDGKSFWDLKPLIDDKQCASMDAKKLSWCHVIDSDDIEDAYVYELPEAQQFIELYGKFNQDVIRSLYVQHD